MSTVAPLTAAASESAAKRGLILSAIWYAVVPSAYSLTEPSGKVIFTILLFCLSFRLLGRFHNYETEYALGLSGCCGKIKNKCTNSVPPNRKKSLRFSVFSLSGLSERPRGSPSTGFVRLRTPFRPFWGGAGARGSGLPGAWSRGRGIPVAAVPGAAIRSYDSGTGMSVPAVRLRRWSGLSIETLRSRRVGRRVPGPRLFRLRRWSGLSIETLRSRRVGRRVPGPRRSGYSFSVWGSSLTETSRVLFSRSACGSGLLVHSSQSRRRCVMSMAA